MTGHGLAGRRTAVLTLIAVVALDVLILVVLLVQPNDLRPLTLESGAIGPGTFIVGVGIALHVLGLAWMVRIIRADPEAGPSSWRSLRDR